MTRTYRNQAPLDDILFLIHSFHFSVRPRRRQRLRRSAWNSSRPSKSNTKRKSKNETKIQSYKNFDTQNPHNDLQGFSKKSDYFEH
jgi:hypothetical protein